MPTESTNGEVSIHNATCGFCGKHIRAPYHQIWKEHLEDPTGWLYSPSRGYLCPECRTDEDLEEAKRGKETR